MKTLFTVAVLSVLLSACVTKFNKTDVCHIEGGERNQHEVCDEK